MAETRGTFVFERQHYYSTAFAIGIVASVVMTFVLYLAQRGEFTELDLAMTLGTVTTMTLGPSPGAWVQGFLAVLLAGGVFALFYAWIFEVWPRHTARAWLGALIGVVHAVIGGAMLGWLMPPLHPATSDYPLLSDPGFMGANYGRATMVVFIVLHVVYGAVVGGWMHFSPFEKKYLAGVAEKAHDKGHPPTTPKAA